MVPLWGWTAALLTQRSALVANGGTAASPSRCLLTRADGDIDPWGGATGIEPRCAVSGGRGWMLTQFPNGSGVETPPPCESSPPSSINTDLAACSVVGSPFKGLRDASDVWIGWQQWKYELVGVCPPSVSDGRVLLVAESLDTVATILVNGVSVGQSQSTHLRAALDVTKALHTGCDNTITIIFNSSLDVGRERQRQNDAAPNASRIFVRAFTDSDADGCHPPLYPNDPTRKSSASSSPNDDGRIWIRKATSDYGWNWGPCFTAGGILRPIHLVAYGPQSPVLRDVVPLVSPTEFGFRCDIQATVLASPRTTKVHLIVSTTWGGNVSRNFPWLPTPGQQSQTFNISLDVPVNAIKLWWPHGMGNQTLYGITVSASTNVASPTAAHMTSASSFSPQISKQVGFRKIELVGGANFHLSVNGIPFFAMGANVIPISSFPAEVSNEQIDELLNAAKAQHMNILRIWGGGDYMPDYFYDAADKLGFLLWHDLMFNNAVYPTHPSDLQLYAEETTYQASRIAHHASLALWSGNNEIEDNVKMLQSPEYLRINYGTLIPALARADPTRPIWPSSPSNGFKEGHGPHDPYPEPLLPNVSGSDPTLGDVHHYKYDGGGWDPDGLPQTHFIDEFGFPSYPSLETLSPYADSPSALRANSTWITHREDWNCRNGYGPDGLANNTTRPCLGPMLERFMNPPPGGWTSPQQAVFESWIHATQALQAACIQGQAEYYRRGRDGPARTMGAIYWQLNSLAPWGSKSSLSHDLRRKALHYAATAFFRPLHASIWFSGNETLASTSVYVHVANDLFNQSFYANAVDLQVVNFRTGQSVTVAIMSIPTIPSMSGAEVFMAPLAALWAKGPCPALEDCFVTSAPTTGTPSLDRAFGFPVQFRNVSLARVGVTVSNWTLVGGDVHFSATTNGVTPYLAFYTDIMGYFEPNSITLLPGVTVFVTFKPTLGAVASVQGLQSSLRANCLNNVGTCLAGR